MQQFWGKTGRQQASGGAASEPDAGQQAGGYHLLVCHCLDVAAVTRVYWQALGGLRRRFAARLGVREDELVDVLTLMMALHDVGKFAEGFQNLDPALFARLRGRQSGASYPHRHDALGKAAWEAWLLDVCQGEGWFDGAQGRAGRRVLDVLGEGVWGHQGMAVSTPGDRLAPQLFDPRGGREAQDALLEFARACAGLLLPAQRPRLPQDREALKPLTWAIAGSLVLCDWIGSDRDFFPFHESIPSLESYWEHALSRAAEALQAKGVLATPPSQVRGFDGLFHELAAAGATPRPAQQWASDWAPEPNTGHLVIIEDETGSGKTEAAWLATHALLRAGCAEGVYIALPTTATADAMFARVAEVYPRMFAASATPSLALAHGRAAVHRGFRELVVRAQGIPDDTRLDEDAPSEAMCAQWLADDRRLAMVAQVGVGTIDQALLSVLPVRYQALRLFGLARHVLVIDEVHASDAYVHQLVQALITFHTAQGGSVVLLSATLPKQMRLELLAAARTGMGGPPIEARELVQAHFPLITSLTRDQLREDPIPSAREEPLRTGISLLEVASADEALMRGVALLAEDEVLAQRCACWIRNTVADAAEAAAALRAQLGPSREVILFHARMTGAERGAIEREVLRRTGKESTPAQRAGLIVVATQVIEQSLDLDFDVMLTDLAPIDLLIQRMGRLRRHRRDALGATHAAPDARGARQLHVLAPVWCEDAPADWLRAPFPRAAYVYPDHGQMWRTMRALRRDGEIFLGDVSGACVRGLLEDVYGDTEVPDGLQDPSWKAEVEALSAKHLAQLNTLRLEAGYCREQQQAGWALDVHTPTRLGEPTTTVRLVAIGPRGGSDPMEHAQDERWTMSEVRLRRYRLEDAHHDDATRTIIEKAKEKMPDRGKFCLCLAVWPDGPDAWAGQGVNSSGEVVDVRYERGMGLMINGAL